jgi:hypothetical protein
VLRSAACVGLASSLLAAGFAIAQQQPGPGGVHVGTGQSVHVPEEGGLHVPAARTGEARPVSLEEAVRVARDELWGIETLSELCVAKDPGNARYHEVAAFSWRSENRDALYVARTAAKRLGPGAMRRTEAIEVSLDASPDACVTHSKNVLAGEMNLGQTAPEAERALLDDLAKHPMPEPEWAERETAIGCIKRALNENGDYKVAVRRCECTGKAFVEATTAAERQAYWKSIEEGKEESQWSLLARKLPDLMRRCGAEWK